MLSSERIRALLMEALNDPKKGLGCCPNPIGVCEEQIGSASLDLRLGSWFLMLQQTRKSEIDLTKSSDSGIENTDGKYNYVPFGEKFVLHPGRFILGSTLEWLRFPKNIGGMITGKSTLGRRGLIIETASGIQPGFTGCLTLEIFNCGEVPIAISPGMRVAQIFFHDISGDIGEPSTKFGGHRKPIFGNFSAENLTIVPQQPSLPFPG